MATTPGGISFQELDDSPKIKITEQGVTAVRRFLVAWSDWRNFTIELMGKYAFAGTSITNVPPMEFPDLPSVVPVDVDVQPFASDAPDGAVSVTLDTQTNTYTGGALVTANYETRWDETGPVSAPNGTYVTLEGDLGAEMMTIPGRMFQWDGTTTTLPDDTPMAVVVPNGQFTLHWKRVVFPPWSTIRSLRGKVNNTTFLGAAAETILFLGASYSRSYQLADTAGFWDIKYQFAESSKALASGGVGGWNHFWKETAASGEHWVKVEAADNDELVFKTADFSTLFVLGSTQFPG